MDQINEKPEKLCELGYQYYFGINVKIDKDKAKTYFRSATNK
ncbi:14072_t:CDS:1, partial [Racocetra fulgida]